MSFAYGGVYTFWLRGWDPKGERNIKISLLVIIVFDRDEHIVSLLLSRNDNDLSFLFENIYLWLIK